MSWFLIALVAPFLWAISNYIDKYLVSRFFEGRFGVFFLLGTLISFIVLPIIFLIEPSVISIPISTALLITMLGIFGASGLLPYFYALQKESVTSVVPLFQMIPVFVYFLGYFILGEQLAVHQTLAAGMVISGAVILSIEMEGKIRFRNDAFWNMMLGCLICAISIVLFKFFALETSYWTTNFWEYVGDAILSVCIIAFAPKIRGDFVSLIRTRVRGLIKINILNEFIGTFASFSIAFATLLAPTALVWSVNGFQAFFVFLFGIIITIFLPRFGQENLARRHIVQKLLAIAIMFVGVY